MPGHFCSGKIGHYLASVVTSDAITISFFSRFVVSRFGQFTSFARYHYITKVNISLPRFSSFAEHSVLRPWTIPSIIPHKLIIFPFAEKPPTSGKPGNCGTPCHAWNCYRPAAGLRWVRSILRRIGFCLSLWDFCFAPSNVQAMKIVFLSRSLKIFQKFFLMFSFMRAIRFRNGCSADP